MCLCRGDFLEKLSYLFMSKVMEETVKMKQNIWTCDFLSYLKFFIVENLIT